ncbi:MAG: hypothetical protein JJ916_07925 [Phycisphaerales bacterium]|nr:hypothetical protein [Phycisphaerales bacterium]
MKNTVQSMIALAITAGSTIAAPITYQGTLEDGGQPANGLYDMRFSLADAPTIGLLLQFIDIADVEVVNGLFEVEIDFDDSWFDGSERWLAVRVEGTNLNPRTKINYAPYAIRATRAQQANLAFDLSAPWVSVDTGVIISATSTGAVPITGRSSNSSGTNAGVYGRTDSGSPNATGVLGEVTDTTPGGFSAGVRGVNNGESFLGVGVSGVQNGSGYGVYGFTPSGTGVYASSSQGTGVFANTNSGDQAGRFVHNDDDTEVMLATNSYAIEARHDQTDGVGTAIYASGGQRAIYGVAGNSGFGNLTRVGVEGYAGAFSTGADTFYGVRGFGQNPASGGSRTAFGVYGSAQVGNSSNTAYGVYGATFGPGGTQYAGYFSGNVHVAGTLSKLSGSFKIDHPLDPENKYLSHSFVESPDMMNIYNGVITLDADGNAVVDLPDYFEALNRDFRYQLTAIGAPMPNLYIASEISSNEFSIAGGVPNAKVSWEVMGIRQDPSAQANPIIVEEQKPEQHRGKYLDPEAYGVGNDQAIHPRPEQH